MPPCSDPDRLRSILERDRAWAIYMIGDLDVKLWPNTRWWCNDDAIVLLYHRFNPPILVTFGPASAVQPLLEEMPAETPLHLHVPPEVCGLLMRRYSVAAPKPMIRMSQQSADVRLTKDAEMVRLSSDDVDAVENLYLDGANNAEAPDFFLPEMIESGIYFGLREETQLVAVAGTHFVNARDSAAAIGNVYTRRDRRRRGLAARSTSAVASALIDAGIRTVALSVGANNAAAILVYERLGFRYHCRFVEGIARLR